MSTSQTKTENVAGKTIKVTILNRYPFVDRTVPNKPVDKVNVTFQLPDFRIGNVDILPDQVDKPAEDQAIAAFIAKMPQSITTTKEIKL